MLHRHDEVIPQLVLAQNPRLAERFVLDSLGPLLDTKTRNREQLLETLQAYLASGSVKDAATAMNLHRHTVLYRLDKLRDLLGGDLDTPATRLRLAARAGSPQAPLASSWTQRPNHCRLVFPPRASVDRPWRPYP